MRYIINTLGCKVNQYETQAMETLLRERGHFFLAQCRGGLDALNAITAYRVRILDSYRVKYLPVRKGVRKAHTVGSCKAESSLHTASCLDGHVEQALPVLYFYLHHSTVIMLSSVMLTFWTSSPQASSIFLT